jgi:hypothetical protein
MAQEQYMHTIVTYENGKKDTLKDCIFQYCFGENDTLGNKFYYNCEDAWEYLYLKKSTTEDSIRKTEILKVDLKFLEAIQFKWDPREEVSCKGVVFVMKDGTKKILSDFIPAYSFLSKKKFILRPALFLMGKDWSNKVWLAGFTVGYYGWPIKRKIREIKFL